VAEIPGRRPPPLRVTDRPAQIHASPIVSPTPSHGDPHGSNPNSSDLWLRRYLALTLGRTAATPERRLATLFLHSLPRQDGMHLASPLLSHPRSGVAALTNLQTRCIVSTQYAMAIEEEELATRQSPSVQGQYTLFSYIEG
jgi:hypothetical protein